jgi:hypothetical protein
MELYLQLSQTFFLYVFLNLQVKWEQISQLDQLREWVSHLLMEDLIQHILHVLMHIKEKCQVESWEFPLIDMEIKLSEWRCKLENNTLEEIKLQAISVPHRLF